MIFRSSGKDLPNVNANIVCFTGSIEKPALSKAITWQKFWLILQSTFFNNGNLDRENFQLHSARSIVCTRSGHPFL